MSLKLMLLWIKGLTSGLGYECKAGLVALLRVWLLSVQAAEVSCVYSLVGYFLSCLVLEDDPCV